MNRQCFSLLTTVMIRWGWVCLSSVFEASKPIYCEKTAPVSASSTNIVLLYVQRNSRKRGSWNYSLTQGRIAGFI